MARTALVAMNAGALLLAGTISIRSQAPPAGQGPAAPPAQTQASGAGAGSIAGHVVDVAGHVVDDAGQPIPDAVVSLARGGVVERALVDSTGHFAFRGLPAGIFGVVATRPGYFGGAIDQHEPTSAARPIELTEHDPAADVTLRLWKGGAIAGTVTSDAGDPLPGVEIFALRRTLIGGRWILSPVPSTTTDDLGRYRIDELTPGDYAVVARPDRDPETGVLLSLLASNPAVSADVMAGLVTTNRARPELDDRVLHYAMTSYRAAATRAGSSLVTIAAAAEHAKTDFRLKASKVVRVSGTLTNAAAAADGLTLRLEPADPGALASPIDAAVTACDEDGRFEFSGVSPGRYVIAVLSAPPQPLPVPPGAANGSAPPLPPNPAWSGSTPVVVGITDLSNVSVPVRQGVIMSGNVSFEGDAPRPAPAQLAQMTVRLDPSDRPAPAGAATWRGAMSADGHFRTVSLPPGEYLLRIGNLPRGWTLLSATSGGHDILDEPIAIDARAIDDVVIAIGGGPSATATGIVHDAPGASVLIFPTEHALWRDTSAQARRLRLTRPADSGGFSVPGLPAGEYFLAAVAGELPAEWQDPGRLEAISAHATRVHLAPGAPTATELTPIAQRNAEGRIAEGRIAEGRASARPDPAPQGRLKPAPPAVTRPAVTRPAVTRPPVAHPADSMRAASVSGTVLDHITRRPAANALVIVAGTDVGLVHVTATDERGQFVFAGLPAGHFLVGAGKPSYLLATAGASRPGRPGTPIALDGGEARRVALEMVRGGVIGGRVMDDRDRAVPGVRVRVIQRRAAGGEVALGGDAGDPVAATTDDRGAYRIFDLAPGDYTVAVQGRGLAPASPPNGLPIGWASTYFPAAAGPADAAAITIAAGETRTSVDVRMPLARLARVEGTVTNGNAPAGSVPQITLRPRGTTASGVILTNLTTRPGPDGRFQFQNVPPGDYTILARSLPPPVPADRQFVGPATPGTAESSAVRWAAQDVVVKEENVAGIELAMRPGLKISGTVHFNGATGSAADTPSIRVGLRPTPGSAVPNAPDTALVDQDGRFSIDGLTPGRYRLYVQVPNNDVLQIPEWFVQTASVENTSDLNALDVPIEITPDHGADVSVTLTRETQELDGVVRDAAGKPARDCLVAIFSADRRFWFPQSRRVATRQSDRDGRFVFGMGAGLPPGDYLIAALPDGRPGEQLDVLLLEELAATATKVTLNSNDSKTVDVRIR